MINRIIALGMYSVLKNRLISDWSVEYMNPDMTPSNMSLDVSKSPKINKK